MEPLLKIFLKLLQLVLRLFGEHNLIRHQRAE
jgi:hypothetical protein